jgi:hypothetical protein
MSTAASLPDVDEQKQFLAARATSGTSCKCSLTRRRRGLSEPAWQAVAVAAHLTRRIERAIALLRGGGVSLTEVCFAVGCSSLGTFSHTRACVHPARRHGPPG